MYDSLKLFLAPTAPRNVTYFLYSKFSVFFVILTWEPPASSNGIILGYNVQVFSAPPERYVRSYMVDFPSQTITISRLNGLINYTLSVYAINRYFSGERANITLMTPETSKWI